METGVLLLTDDNIYGLGYSANNSLMVGDDGAKLFPGLYDN